jgi:fibronectin type 3 domain-containing protein
VVKSISVDATGFYVGNEGTGGGIFDGRAAFDWGTYNQRWRKLCLGATQSIAPVNGVLYAASHGHNCEADGGFEDGARHFFNAEMASSKDNQPWWPQANDGIGEGIGPRAIVSASSGSGDFLWTGGEFTLINGVAQRGLARFGQGPDTGAPLVPQTPNVSSSASGQVTVTWRASTDDDDRSLTYLLYRGTTATPTLVATLQADSQFYSRPQLSFTETGLAVGSSQTYRVKASDGSNVSAFSLSRTVVVAGAVAAYPSRIVADGASVYFRMTEPNGTAAGSLGSSALGGSYVNASTRAGQESALVGAAADTSAAFDGVSSFLRTEVSSPAPTVYSIETWFKTSSTTGGKLVGYGNRAMMNGGTTVPLSSTFDRQVYVANDGRVLFGVNSGVLTTLASPAGLNNGQWHQVVATQGPSGMALYVDGARVGRNAVTTAQAYSGFWRVGGDNLSGWPSRPTNNYFTGNIDETAIYEKALTSAQVADHFRLSGRTNPAVPAPPTDTYGGVVVADGPDLFWRLGETAGSGAVDASGNNMGGTYAAGVTRGVAGAVAGTSDTAISTNGATSGIVYSAVSGGSPAAFSEELWFKTASTTGGKLIGFGSSSNVTSASYDKHVYLGVDGKLRFGVNSGGAQVITSPNAYNNNVWHHVVATQDGSGMKLYVDGVQVASGSVTTNQNLTGFWRVGGDNLSGWPSRPTTDYFSGSIDEVAVYTKALTATQVQTHYALGTNGTPPDTQAPSVPGAVAGTVTGSNVNLSWTASTDNVGVVKYEVHRSATTGFTPGPATKIGDVTGTSYPDAARPTGTWYYRVVAVDAAGNASAGSTESSAVIPDSLAPTAPTALTAAVTAQTVALSWTASTDDIGVTGYQVYRSTAAGFTPGAATKIATVTSGTAYSDAGLAGGTYYYLVQAIDAAGNPSASSNEAPAAVQAPADTQAPTVPTAATATASGTTITVAWTASTDNVGVTGYEVHRSATTGFTPSPSTKIADVTAGTTFADSARPVGTWYYRVVAADAAGNSSAGSAQASATVADTVAPSVPAGLGATVVNQDVSLSWTASTDNVAVTGYEVHRSATSGFTPSSMTKIATVTSGASFTDTVVTGGSWFYRVVALDAAGNASAASGQASAVVSAPADTQAPTVPAGLTAAVSGSTVALTWTASSDNVGVAGYDVHRSATSGFTPSPSTKVGTVTSGTSYSDAARPVGTWYYKVIAVDATGNASAGSAQDSAVVAGGAVQTVVLSPTEDTYAVQATATTNYGTSASMASRGGSSSYAAYLKFALPTAPAGTTLVGATFSVKTTTDTFAGSVDSHLVSLAPSTWTDTALTWGNRPTIGTSIGSFAPTTLPSTRYNAILDASALSGMSAGAVTLAVNSTSTDNLWFWSQNYAATASRPTLTLTYQAN